MAIDPYSRALDSRGRCTGRPLPLPSKLPFVVIALLVQRLSPLPLLLCVGLLAACQGTHDGGTEAAYPPITASTFGEMRNVSVSGPLWFGGTPCVGDLELAKRRGIERVIDLCAANEALAWAVGGTCESLDMEYLAAHVGSTAEVTDETVDLVLGWLSTEPAVPTLMFDASGGRCASLVAIHRVVALGVPVEEALVEARRAGMKPGEPEDFVRRQVARLRAGSEGAS